MVVAPIALYERAIEESKPDADCHPVYRCSTVVSPGDAAFSDLHPLLFGGAALVAAAGAACLSLALTAGRTTRSRFVDACALCLVSWLTVVPLTFHVWTDWHGEVWVLYWVPLGIASLPLSIACCAAVPEHFFEFPYYEGNPTFGPFSARLGAWMFVLSATAYLQWFVLFPRVRSWIRARRSRV